MKTYKFDKLLTSEGWKQNIYVRVSDHGVIDSISEAPDGKDVISIKKIGIPGFQNAHSHAFQYAMAGLAEGLVPGHKDDDFGGGERACMNVL